MSQNIANDEALKHILRIVGGIELFAIPFLFIPFSWMNFVHENFVHLGPLTHTPVVEYMARTLTALYAFHGAVIVRLSFDVPRYRPIANFVGWLQVLLGLAAFAIDFAAGLPWFWIVGEGMGLAGGGLAIVFLSWQPKGDGPSNPTHAATQ
jgi:hypothetical protein